MGSSEADVEDVSPSLFNKVHADVTTLCLQDGKLETAEMDVAVPLKMLSKFSMAVAQERDINKNETLPLLGYILGKQVKHKQKHILVGNLLYIPDQQNEGHEWQPSHAQKSIAKMIEEKSHEVEKVIGWIRTPGPFADRDVTMQLDCQMREPKAFMAIAEGNYENKVFAYSLNRNNDKGPVPLHHVFSVADFSEAPGVHAIANGKLAGFFLHYERDARATSLSTYMDSVKTYLGNPSESARPLRQDLTRQLARPFVCVLCASV